MSEREDKDDERKRNEQQDSSQNPQLVRLKMLKKKTKSSRRMTRSRRKSANQDVSESLKFNDSLQKETPIKLSSEDATMEFSSAKYALSKEESLRSDKVAQDKSLLWNNARDSELERRLEKLNKILQKMKVQEEKIKRLRDSVKNWEKKYEKRLHDLEQSVNRFEWRCKKDRVELNEQISRVEEMSEANMAIRQRIEKKLVVHGPSLDPESSQPILAMTLNLMRAILFYLAQIRDAFFAPKSMELPTADVTSSEENLVTTESSSASRS